MKDELYPNEELNAIDKASIKAAKTDDKTWRPYYFDRFDNGLLVKGCSTRPIKRGINKGLPKYLRGENEKTVLLTRAMVDAEEK